MLRVLKYSSSYTFWGFHSGVTQTIAFWPVSLLPFTRSAVLIGQKRGKRNYVIDIWSPPKHVSKHINKTQVTLKMEAEWSSETLEQTYYAARVR